MLSNHGPRVIRQPIRGLRTPASRAAAVIMSVAGREVASRCPRWNDRGSVLRSGEQTAW